MINKEGKKIVIFVVLAILTIWTVWSNLSIQTSHFVVEAEELPDAFDGFTIAQVSDLHNAEFGENHEKLIRILREESPDMIAITGDLVDSNNPDIGIALSFAKQAAEIAPCYYVTGNHEVWLGGMYQELKTGLEEAGVEVLDDETVLLQRGNPTATIQIAGLMDTNFKEGGDNTVLEGKLAALNEYDGYTVLLAHRPEYFESYRDYKVELALTGHAHGGQFRIPFVGGIVAPNQGLFPQYDAGVYTEDNTTMIVSRGVGNSVIPVRFNNRPEVVVVELRSR